jgi:hypothetical protein
MKFLSILTAGLIALGLPHVVLAQNKLAANADMAVKITEARKANAALMRQYTWSSRTELIVEGQVIVPQKQMTVQVQNFDYSRIMPALMAQMANPKQSPSTASSSFQTVEKELRDLKALLDQGLISQSDYDEKKAEILKGM